MMLWDPTSGPNANVAARYLARFFRDAGRLFRDISDVHVGKALHYLVCASESGYGRLTHWGIVEPPLRIQIVENIYFVYRDVFAPRCPMAQDRTPNPEPCQGLDCICAMWWDMTGMDFRSDLLMQASGELLLGISTIESVPCRQSALYGICEIGLPNLDTHSDLRRRINQRVREIATSDPVEGLRKTALSVEDRLYGYMLRDAKRRREPE